MKFSQKKIGKDLHVSIAIDGEETGKIETLISTLDEIISHIYSASKTIQKAEEL
jgi:hypothetical protein